jgi:hypothetical protein
MKKLFQTAAGLLFGALALFASVDEADSAASQVTPGYLSVTGCPGGITPCFFQFGASFNATGTASLSVSNASSNVALASTDTTLVLTNTGATNAFFKLGDSTVTATTSDTPILAGRTVVLNIGSSTYIAAITASSTTTLKGTTGTGTPLTINLSDGTGNIITSTSNALDVNIKSGAAAGGTSSNFNAAFPGAGTAIGVKNGANMVNLTADGSSNLNVNCASGCTSTSDASFTGSQSSATTLVAATDASGFNSISFGFTAVGSGNTVKVQENNDNGATWFDVPISNATTGGTAASNGITPATGTTYVAGLTMRYVRLQITVYGSGTVTTQGTLKGGTFPNNTTLGTGANVIGALSANQSVNNAQTAGTTTATNNGVVGAGVQRVTIASDSTGQVTLATGSNTIGSAKITDGTTVAGVIAGTTALKTDMSSVAGTATSTAASGVQKVGIVGATGTALDSTAGVLDVNTKNMNGVAVTMGNGVAGTGVQRVTIASDSTGTSIATQATASNLNAQVVGSVASGATDSGNPVKVGCTYNSTLPTLTNGQRGDCQVGTRGSVNTQIMANDGTGAIGASGNLADAISNNRTYLNTQSTGLVYNGTTWDRTYALGATGTASTGVTAVGPIGKYNSSPITITDGQFAGIQLDANGYLKVNTAAGAAAGGTSSNFGSAFPTPGTAIGAKNGANMVNLTADGSNYLNVDCASGCTSVTDIVASGSLTSTASVTSGTLNGVSTATIQITGSWVATVQFEGSTDGTNYFSINAIPVGGGTTVTSATANGNWNVNVAGLQLMRVRASAYTSGTIVITGRNSAGAGLVALSNSLPTGTNVIGALSANQSTNVAQLAGTTTDTNSGVKSAGTLRVVLATDQPQLTNKLLVTPDANSAVNVAQIGGTNTSNTTAGILDVNVKNVNTVATTMGNGIAGTCVQRVTIASDSTGQVTLATGANTIGALTANQSVNNAQVAGATTSTAASGVQKVGVVGNAGSTFDAAIGAGTAPTNMIVHGGIYNSTEISPTTGQSAAIQLDSKGRTRGVVMDAAGNTRGANVNASNQLSVSVDNSNVSTNLAQIAGTTTSNTTAGILDVNVKNVNNVATTMGNGIAGTGVQRVTIASDSTGVIGATESGTWTVQPGNTQNSTAWLVGGVPLTSGGLSTYVLEPAASDNHANIKNGAGQVYSINYFNNSATINYIRLYNAATGFNGCNSATNLVWEGHILGNSTNDAGAVITFPEGIAFSTGISICVTSGYGQTNTTAATASAISLDVMYK